MEKPAPGEIEEDQIVPAKEWAEQYGFTEEAVISRIQSGILEGFQRGSDWFVIEQATEVEKGRPSDGKDDVRGTNSVDQGWKGILRGVPLWEIEWSIYIFFGAGILFLPFINWEADATFMGMCLAVGMGFVSLVAYNLKTGKTYWYTEHKRENHPFLFLVVRFCERFWCVCDDPILFRGALHVGK